MSDQESKSRPMGGCTEQPGQGFPASHVPPEPVSTDTAGDAAADAAKTDAKPSSKKAGNS